MKRALVSIVAALSLSACGMGVARPMIVAAECASGDLTVQIEAGSYHVPSDCPYYATALRGYEDEYDARFGHLGPVTVRLRNTDDLRTTGVDESFEVSGHTYDDGVIDLARGRNVDLPHELNHVRRGAGHAGWCLDYEPWSEQVLGYNQRSYLGC